MNVEAGSLNEPRAAEGHYGVGYVLEDSLGTDAEVHDLTGDVRVRPVEVGRGLGGDVNLGVGTAVDLDAAAVAVDEAVAELLQEDKRHPGQVLVEVDWPVDVQRRPLVVTRDARGSTVTLERELE